MRENAYRITFALLIATVMVLAGCQIARSGQKPITIDAYPKAALLGSRTAFRVRIRIEENDNNRRYSYAADCGVESKYSQGPVDFVTQTRFEIMTIGGKCFFQACVHRIEGSKVKNYCDVQEVLTSEKPP